MCHFCNQRHDEKNCPNRKKINSNIIIECPICRKENTFDKNQTKIYGLQEKCKVCLDNSIEIYLPNCGHACMCMDCVGKLNKNDINYNVIDIEELKQNDFWKPCIERCLNSFQNIL